MQIANLIRSRWTPVAVLLICVAAAASLLDGGAALPDDISTMSLDQWERYKFAHGCVPVQSLEAHTEAARCANGREIRWGSGL